MQADWAFNVHLGTNTGKMRKAEQPQLPWLRDMKKFLIMKSGDIYTKINNICRAKSSLLRRFIGSQNISLKKKNRWSFKGLQSIYTQRNMLAQHTLLNIWGTIIPVTGFLICMLGMRTWDPLVCVQLWASYITATYRFLVTLNSYRLFFLHKHSSDKIKIENKYEPGWYFFSENWLWILLIKSFLNKLYHFLQKLITNSFKQSLFACRCTMCI